MFWLRMVYKSLFMWKGDSFLYFSIYFSNNLWSWRLGFGGFFIDDLYARLIETLLRQIFILPAIFILDSWVSFWLGADIVKTCTNYLANWFYIETFSLLNLVNILLVSLIFSFLSLNLMMLYC